MAFAPIFQRPFSATFDRRAAAAAAGNGLLNALIAYWPGNEASGDLLDAHTGGLDLAQSGTVDTATGKVYSTARRYDANGEIHTRSAANSTALSVGTKSDFTIAAWVYLLDLSTLRWIAEKRGAVSDTIEYQLIYSNTENRFRITVRQNPTSTGVNWSNAPSINTWYFVCAWHDGSNLYIQVDNGTPVSVASGGTQTVAAAPFSIGNASWVSLNPYPGGVIGPVAFWSSTPGNGGVLSAAQRTALWANGNGLPYSAFTA